MFAVLLVGVGLGALLVGRASAQAQPAPAAATAPTASTVDVKAMTAPSPVVAAVPYQSRTDYEQDPFDTTRLRRTTMTMLRLVIIHADGTMEVKDAPQ
jgi:hypothetical protein